MPRMTPATTPPDSLYQLVDKFERGRAQFTQPDYNEAQLRQEFVNPFFRALGWDVGDSHQVLHEAGLKSGGSTKHPDYSFLSGRRRAFYVETKKPAINISQQIEPAGQLRSYGWSGNTAVGILTNFAEFAVYDCRIPPEQGDPAAAARVWHLTSAQYPASWTRLCETLSPLAVRQGKHRDLLADVGKGALPVDAAFLRDMENWRKTLAEQLYKQARFIDRELSQRELNLLVQRTIDRIVFLRIAEDRSLEPYGTLERVVREKQVYEKIKNLYRAADKKYNSGLFHFDASDKMRGAPDNLSMDIYIPDNVLQKIIFALYPPQSRYEFSVIAADILGQVYERFLGKVIEVRSDGIETSVAVEEKPEVRKAGGVYYTPAYIVNYIVENTLGKLLEGKNPDQAAELRVLDPACGSGSFLTGAYQYLLDWHIDYYRRHPAQFRNRRRETAQGMLLTTAEKRRILLNNIYGVDLDQSAVEVSKLSLLLKMLENENDSTGMRDLDGPILPDLGGNIKWGNSLVGSDFYADKAWANADEEELLRVKAFDWDSERGFGAIMAAGGFDAVIGNPPYGAFLSSEQISYLSNRHPVAAKFPDSYILFVVKALELLKPNRLMSYIVPNTFCDLESCDEFRKWILTNHTLHQIWQTGWAFKDAVVDTLVMVVSNEQSGQEETVLIEKDKRTYRRRIESFLSNELHKIDYRNTESDRRLLDKIRVNTVPLGSLATVNAGVKMYERGKGTPPQTRELIKERPFSRTDAKPDGWRVLYRGKSVSRYQFARAGEYVNYGVWLAAPRKPELFQSPKILMRRTDDRLLACLDTDDAVCVNSCHVIKLRRADAGMSYGYMLGVLNSSLMQHVFALQNPQMIEKVFAEIKVIYVRRLPIRTIDFDNPADVQMHAEMVALVESMLNMHRQLPGLNDEARRVVELRIEATDRDIDALVYRLYGLSDDEVGVVGGW
ncbi:MAG: N-6 DNA methylase [Chloroflexi bacterium]|nr:N-6 DNA methylase [Chloroflexota bacterium]